MLRNVRHLIESERGFSLPELLVVTSIIGVLAAMGLPAFLGPQKKGHDGDAKANARNAVTSVETCFADTQDFTRCDTGAELEATGAKLGMDLTDAATKQEGAVSITATPDTYTIAGYSRSSNEFAIDKASDSTSTRSCTTAGQGGCGPAGVW